MTGWLNEPVSVWLVLEEDSDYNEVLSAHASEASANAEVARYKVIARDIDARLGPCPHGTPRRYSEEGAAWLRAREEAYREAGSAPARHLGLRVVGPIEVRP